MKWSERDLLFLRDNYDTETLISLAKSLYRTVPSVKTMAKRMGLMDERLPKSPIKVRDGVAYVPLHGKARGMFTRVSLDKLDLVKDVSWSLEVTKGGKRYARGRFKGKMVRIHYILVNNPAGTFISHADGDGLNNVDENLVIKGLSPSENSPEHS